MKTLAIGSLKGGTAKSTTAHTLGVALARKYKTLLVDLDPQGSLTSACGIPEQPEAVAEVLGKGVTLAQISIDVGRNLWLAPADLSLATVEMAMNDQLLLRKALEGADFDLVILDTPPSFGMLTINALGAADAVLIPAQCTAVDLRGLAVFMQAIETVQQNVNPGLSVLGIVPVFYDRRIITHQEALRAMKSAGWPVLNVAIGRSTRVAEASAVNETILTFEKDNPRASEYQKLAKEVQKWLEK